MHTKQTVNVLGDAMEMLVFAPPGNGPHPGVVHTQHLPVAHKGLEADPFTLDVGERLANAGYACVIPYMFHWWPPEEDIQRKRDQWRDDWAVADLDVAHEILCAVDGVDKDHIGIMGHCWGGRNAWIGACHNTNYKACGVFYGGRIKLGMGDGAPPPIGLAGNIACDLIEIFGNTDENPSPADVNDLGAALTKAGVAHEFHQYDDAGHGFQDFANPDRFRAEATDDAWEKFFAFFDARLKT